MEHQVLVIHIGAICEKGYLNWSVIVKHSCNLFILEKHLKGAIFEKQLLSKKFLDSDFCHNYLNTPVFFN